MTVYLHNTLTRAKEEFRPIDAKNVRVYACGPTVYNYAHIGNARPAVIFDLLTRVLRHEYGAENVRYTRNITDIEDKIMDAAKEAGVPISEITEKFTRIYNEDMAALGVEKPDHQPRATDYIPQMIGMIEKLIKAGNAYAAEGHVLFNVPSWPRYGGLSRRSHEDLIAGARVEVAPYKKDAADFVLWKPSSPDQPGWDGPWGRGRPGWHIECSAMNEAINGEHFDIHAGGEDLIFPHHENEIAQSVCAHGGKPYANVWMHNGHLMVEGKKMSKSLGNFLLVHDLVRQHPPEALRYVLLSAHYRQPLDFTHDAVAQAKNVLDRWYGFLRDHAGGSAGKPPAKMMEALKDDLNTPKALMELQQAMDRGDTAEILAGGAVLGLLRQKPEEWFGSGANPQIENLVAARAEAKKKKDFAAADKIRREIEDLGFLLEDTAQGTRWKKKS
jgi:cysteinyl-tRNA synthetase